jgi:hypothetical protein
MDKVELRGYTLGDRSQESAFFLREAIPKNYRRRATRSDFWEPYEIAFPSRTHRCCGKADRSYAL